MTTGVWGLCHLCPCSAMPGSARRCTSHPLGRGGGVSALPRLWGRNRSGPGASACCQLRLFADGVPPPRGGVCLRSPCAPLLAQEGHRRPWMSGMSPGKAVPHPPAHSCTRRALSVLVCRTKPEAGQSWPLLRAPRHCVLLWRGEKRHSATARRLRWDVRLFGDAVLRTSPGPRREHRARIKLASRRPR